jgi:hypothetical protein
MRSQLHLDSFTTPRRATAACWTEYGGSAAFPASACVAKLAPMTASPATPPTMREADNELYDHGCDLVAATAAIRRAAGFPDAVRAVPAVLGCIESALQELLWAAAALEQTSSDVLRHGDRGRQSPRTGPKLERMHQGFANLQQALGDAERAAAAARALAARAFADQPRSGRPARAHRQLHEL